MAMGWFAYQKITDDTYEGMSIIPEQQKDIPLFKGLKPTDHEYVMEGNHVHEIYDFYRKELPMLGWNVEYKDSALADEELDNDWAGFTSRWRKDGFDGELWISAHYNSFEEQTEVIFDKHPMYHSSTWIDHVPDRICVYRNIADERCAEIADKAKIEEIVGFINGATDWKKETFPRDQTSVIEMGNLHIEVL